MNNRKKGYIRNWERLKFDNWVILDVSNWTSVKMEVGILKREIGSALDQVEKGDNPLKAES